MRVFCGSRREEEIVRIRKLLAILAVALALAILLTSAVMAGNCADCHQKSGVDNAVMIIAISTSMTWNQVYAKVAVATATDVSRRYHQTAVAVVITPKEVEVNYKSAFRYCREAKGYAVNLCPLCYTKSPTAPIWV